MKNLTQQLNEIIRNISIENANTRTSQLSALLDVCLKSRIRFSKVVDYDIALASFTAEKFPEWHQDAKNKEIEMLMNLGKYDEAAVLRDQTLSFNEEMLRQFRLEKYGTEDWFIEISDQELLFLPTKNDVIDSLLSDCN